MARLCGFKKKKQRKLLYLACARFWGFFWFLQIFHKTIIHILKSLNEELFDIIFKLNLSICLNLVFTVVLLGFLLYLLY